MNYYHWLVIWFVFLAMPLGDYTKEMNEYTGIYPGTPDIYNLQVIERRMKKVFETKEEAEEFIRNKPENLRIGEMELREMGHCLACGLPIEWSEIDLTGAEHRKLCPFYRKR